MKVIYLCAAYRATTENGVYSNITEARRIAASLWESGLACICPHLNTAFMGGLAPDLMFLNGDVEILLRCDAVYIPNPLVITAGMRMEIDAANGRGVKVLRGSLELAEWRKENQ